MANPSTTVVIPGGQTVFALPVTPAYSGAVQPANTWAENVPPRAKQLTQDVGATVYWHRNRPIFIGTATAAFSVPTNSFTPLPMTALYDNYGGMSDPAPTGSFHLPSTSTPTTPTPGMDVYLTIAYVPFNSNSSTASFATGTVVGGGGVVQGTTMPASGSHSVTVITVDLTWGNPAFGTNVDDYIYIVGYQSTGAAVNTLASGKTTTMTVLWVATTVGLTATQPGTPHSWIDQDEISATATGASSQSPGVKVPLATEVTRVLAWLQYPPVARIDSVGTAQTIPNNAWTSIQFPTAYWDPYGGWVSGTNTRWTVPAGCAGLYLATGFAAFTESTATHAGYRAVRLRVNGTTAYGGVSIIPVGGAVAATTAINAMALLRLAAGDYVEVQMIQTQGSALSINGSSEANASHLNMLWLSQ